MLESLFNKVVDLEDCNFIKRRLQRRCFPVKFAKFFRTFFTEHLLRLLLSSLSVDQILHYFQQLEHFEAWADSVHVRQMHKNFHLTQKEFHTFFQ